MAIEVPRYDQPQVRQAPLPGARQTPQVPLEALGGGRPAAGVFRAAGDLAETGGQINAQEFNREAEASVRDYMAQLSAEETRLKVKLQSLKGSAAFGATEQTLKEFDASRDRLLKDVGNQYVKERVSAHAQEFRKGLFHASEIHVAGEREGYEKKNTAALVMNERNNASTGYVDPDSPTRPARVMAAISRQRAAVADQLRGQSPETIQAAQAVEESRTHMEVLDRMLAGGNDALGKKYYEANQAGFFGDDKAQAEKMLQVQSTLGAASRLVESEFTPRVERVDTGGNNWTLNTIQPVRTIKEFRDRLPKDLDDKTREMALDLARARFRDDHIADEQRQDGIFKEAWNTIAAGGQIPVARMTSLDPERQRALNTFARQLARGEEPETNPQVLTDIYAMPRGELAKLSPEQLLAKYKNNLSPIKYDWLLDRWAAAKDQKGEKFQSLISDDDRILRAAQGLGIGGITAKDDYKSIKEKPEKADALWKLREAVDARMVSFHADKKVNPDDKQKSEIVAGVVRDLSKKIVVEQWGTGRFDEYGREYPPVLDSDTKLLGTYERRIIDLTPDQVRSSVFQIPGKIRQEFLNMANSARVIQPGTSMKAWEDANRERVNLAFLALEAGADDDTIKRILTTGK